jgi:predicted CXXCH cytochrome family protein
MNLNDSIPAGNGRRWGRTVTWIAALLLFAALALAAVGSMGCNSENRYRTLSFFFDGVPNPNAPSRTAGGAGGGAVDEFAPNAAVQKVYIHKPYADGMIDSKKCAVCHVGSTNEFESFRAVTSDVCLKCHKDKLTQYPVMHGPVTAVECTLCHAAHESTIPGMLNYAAPKVCVQCHDRELLSPNPPEHLAADSKCLSCHFAHGGPAHKLLRASAVAPGAAPRVAPRVAPPATRPAGAPAGAGA